MTDWVKELNDLAEDVLSTAWDVRDGNVVPESEDVALADGAVKLDATFLYADLAGSSRFAKLCPWETTAKIIRAYLACSTKLILAWGGKIRSFDGDRVMGVFIGDMKNTHASYCAREIDWTVETVLDVKARQKFKSVKGNDLHVRHAIGIDGGSSVAVRAGVRANNDLIWIGRPPSFAARLSELREYPFTVFISGSSYKVLPDAAKFDTDGTPIWESRKLEFLGENVDVYRTKYTRVP